MDIEVNGEILKGISPDNIDAEIERLEMAACIKPRRALRLKKICKVVSKYIGEDVVIEVSWESHLLQQQLAMIVSGKTYYLREDDFEEIHRDLIAANLINLYNNKETA